PASADGRPLNLNFETGTLNGWKSEGNAFVGQPVKGDESAKRRGKKSNHTGEYWIGGFELRGDRPQGMVTSDRFAASYPFASYLIGGGSTTKTRVEIVTADDGQVFHSASGKNIEAMARVVVDLQKVIGRQIFIRIIDQDSGGWGHVNFDDFRFHER